MAADPSIANNKPETENKESSNAATSSLPTKMQALVETGYDEKDPSNAIQLKEIDMPVLQAKQILIKVHAASLNAADWKMAAGWVSLFVRLKLRFLHSYYKCSIQHRTTTIALYFNCFL